MATVQDVIDRVRDNYGERISTQLSDARLLRVLSDALKQIYNDLPDARLRLQHTSTSLDTSTGSVALPAGMLRVVAVRNGTSGLPISRVESEAIPISDSTPYMKPKTQVYALSANKLMVRGPAASYATTELVYVPQPAVLASPATTLLLDDEWLPALAMLAAAKCFLQEEESSMASAMIESYKAAIAGQAFENLEVAAS